MPFWITLEQYLSLPVACDYDLQFRRRQYKKYFLWKWLAFKLWCLEKADLARTLYLTVGCSPSISRYPLIQSKTYTEASCWNVRWSTESRHKLHFSFTYAVILNEIRFHWVWNCFKRHTAHQSHGEFIFPTLWINYKGIRKSFPSLASNIF